MMRKIVAFFALLISAICLVQIGDATSHPALDENVVSQRREAILTRAENFLAKTKQSLTNKHDMQSRLPGDPILEALIVDTAAYVSATGQYLLAYQQTSASLKRVFGGDGPDFFQGTITVLLQQLQSVLYAAGASTEQVQTLHVSEFKQAMWYRMDYQSDQFPQASTLLHQLITSINIDFLVPYSSRRPEFLDAIAVEFFYSYLSLASYMGEYVQEAVLREVAVMETTAVQLAADLGVPSSEVEGIMTEIRDIFTAKFADINLAMNKFYFAAMDAHVAVTGIVLRYYQIMQ